MIEKDNKKYLTVKEFAAAANISNKAVYQQLKTRLKEYSCNINGITYICDTAIQAYYSDNSSGQVKSSQVSSQVESSLESKENKEIEALKMLIEELKQEKESLKQDKEDLKQDKEQLIKDKEYLQQEALKWQQLLADERNKVKLLEAAEEPLQEINYREVEEAAEEQAAENNKYWWQFWKK